MAPGAPDAVVVGAGPNGLAAAISIAAAGRSVTVYEAAQTAGGGCRSAELTLPGFVHDICSAVHPLAAASPFFRGIHLETQGLELVHSPFPLAHPLDDGPPAVLRRSVQETADALGSDGPAYRRLMGPLTDKADVLIDQFVGPLRPPRHPLTSARFGLKAIRSASGLASSVFGEARAQALFCGMAAHSLLELHRPATAGFGLLLGLLAHSHGWPVARGGSQAIIDAMAAHLNSLGGEIRTGERIDSASQLPDAKVCLFDVTPRQLLQIASSELPSGYRAKLERYRYGPGSFKMDFALDGPIPWKSEECLGAATVHLGGTREELEAGERAVARGEHPSRPFVLLAQPSLFDPGRAPQGRHTAWAYCHVPNGSQADMAGRVESQIERFAPGFRDRILEKAVIDTAGLERYNANYVGGDINGGAQDMAQMFTRPVARLDPYSTPNPRIYLCSSSTPPGGGVHGMCGYFAARSALRKALA